jgi:histidinol-phosphatase (PHP family)
VKEIITEILKQVIQDGKGIEVNTSSHRIWPEGTDTIQSCFEALQGLGRHIGSDSHEKHHLGAHIEDTKLDLNAFGHEQYCIFEGMRPIFQEL